ncbi:nitrous oxide reductase family maturation protein NosD [Marinoscillum sp. MHG1-6]|uniref:nitrous oxide reductase family maturation protein NosD n=1 Tax=Marinoscillum sp. MHG1-6 TaxID=2959627 RepID=UPI0021576F4A|nr:nitrous oxide reductase family maturation protein NosD [Marinoscillum sp. MHG1-6]
MFLRITISNILLMVFLSGICREIVVSPQEGLISLKQAIEMANHGDTIRVKPGTYECRNLFIEKPLTLIGEKGAVLDGGNESYVLKLLADNITIEGFEINNSGKSYTKDYAAIYVSGTSGFRIIANKIDQSFFGILVEKSRNGLIRDNRVNGNAKREDESGNGIHLWHCDSVKITNNEVSGMRDGIYLEFVSASQVTQNHTHANVRYGLHFMFSSHDDYVGNTFENNGAGVAVMFSKWIRMESNNFIKNWGTASYGLLLKEIYDGEVINNRFEENTMGIYVDGSSRVNYLNNTLKQNGWAIKVSGGCYSNQFSHNNFIGNSFDISYNSRMNDNTFHGNFWSEYTGYDLDKDGKGDIPYRPVKLFSYIVNQTPETIVLLRSLFVDIINFSEKVSPVFTPDDLVDDSPSMKMFL